MTGRPRNPNAIKKRQGTYRQDRDGDLDVPEGVPGPPGFLDPVALSFWDDVIELARTAGTLTEADQLAAAMLCVALAEFKDADIIARTEGTVVKATRTKKDGTIVEGGAYQHPAVGVRTNAWKKVVAMLREFGLTPSARSGMKMAPGGKEEDPIREALRNMQRQFAAQN